MPEQALTAERQIKTVLNERPGVWQSRTEIRLQCRYRWDTDEGTISSELSRLDGENELLVDVGLDRPYPDEAKKRNGGHPRDVNLQMYRSEQQRMYRPFPDHDK